jgi:hypothetical protein
MDISPERIELANAMNSFSTLIILAYLLRKAWTVALPALYRMWIGVGLLLFRRTYQDEINERLRRFV